MVSHYEAWHPTMVVQKTNRLEWKAMLLHLVSCTIGGDQGLNRRTVSRLSCGDVHVARAFERMHVPSMASSWSSRPRSLAVNDVRSSRLSVAIHSEMCCSSAVTVTKGD